MRSSVRGGDAWVYDRVRELGLDITHGLSSSTSSSVKRTSGTLTDWQEGRAASPDQRDYVILATEVFTQHFTGYVPTDREEEIADAIYERESMGDWGVRDIAEALYDDLYLGAPALAE